MASNADDVLNFDLLELPEEVLMSLLEPMDDENISQNDTNINGLSENVPIKQETRAEQSVNVESFIQGQKKSKIQENLQRGM